MMVVFVSQCEKKALRSTRQVLDAFADRIGDNTWRTVITEDGLAVVRSLLRKSATKNTAVACHWIRSRSRSELVWVVGSRSKFSKEGLVPVNSTKKNLGHSDWENDWTHLPQIKALTAMAALLHDLGKTSVMFQEKLKTNSKQGDPLRHEWVSCALLHALVIHSGDLTSDAGWLHLLHEWSFDEHEVAELARAKNEKLLSSLPPLAKLVAWLMLSHHRLPALYGEGKKEAYAETARSQFDAALAALDENWGYKNDHDGSFEERANACFTFKFGLLKESTPLAKQMKKWAGKLMAEEQSINYLLSKRALRPALQYARLCLMLSDHYISSLDAEPNWQGSSKLFANTDSTHKGLKQKLDEHLLRVSEQALKIAQSLARFSEQMEKAYDVKSLKQKSPADFAWQDRVVEKVKNFRQAKQVNEERQGWFVVNMASTGCGKTIANAKIMQAISEDGEGIRYILALGLRTLTLQTGDEYRDRIGLSSDELAVLIGSAAFKELYEQQKNEGRKSETSDAEDGSESLEGLLDEELDYTEGPTAEFLDNFFPQGKPGVAAKNKAFLYKPVLACTIDHIMGATETIKGGKYILPFLRLMSSDLVIDEVDDFGLQDLIAIGRLVQLAGMLGRSVAISSATIPPGLAEGLYNAYQEGWECYRSFYQKNTQPLCVWCDEFSAKVEMLQGGTTEDRCRSYAEEHNAFVAKRAHKLEAQRVKRKAYIVSCDRLFEAPEDGENAVDKVSLEEPYFAIIREEAKKLHAAHSWGDPKTGKRISFGVVRVANIGPCIALSKYLMTTGWEADFSPAVMAYHSRQVLLLRHEQERHLDAVLKRKEKPGEEPLALSNPRIRKCIDGARGNNVLFILVATPVEEVGRDHDLDWAIIEPSSFRSIIQLAGRILRHRTLRDDIAAPNIAIMQYNLKGISDRGDAVFCRPGYETNQHKLRTHDMRKLVDERELRKGVNAIPRIVAPSGLKADERLADLEHAVMNDFKNRSSQGPAVLQGWLTGFWWLTALPQQFNRFREGSPQTKLYLLWQDGKAVFHERAEKGDFVEREVYYGLTHSNDENESESRFWLQRQYSEALARRIGHNVAADEQEYAKKMREASERFGEVSVLQGDLEKKNFVYVDQFGLMEKK